jgi:hypothetical protein
MCAQNQAGKFQCPCCSYFTFEEQGHCEICPVCFWEDDWHQTEDILDDGGPNAVSLLQGRINYQEFGAMESQYSEAVRPPLPDELPDIT